MFSLTELGKRLREAREEKKISLDELQAITKIQKRYLIAIEEGNYSIMPGSFYVRAFIKQYAEAVGLDPEALFEEYKSDVPDSQHHELPEQLSRVKSRQQVTPEFSRFFDLLPKILGTLLIVGGLVAVWLFFQQGNENGTPDNGMAQDPTEVEQSENSPLENTPKNEEIREETKGNDNKEEKQEEPATQDDPVHTLNVLEVRGRESTVELTNANQLILQLASKGNSWVEVSNGKGHSFFASNLKQNETQQFDLSNESEVFLKIGNAIDIEMRINGQPFTFPIDPNKEVFQKIKILYKKS